MSVEREEQPSRAPAAHRLVSAGRLLWLVLGIAAVAAVATNLGELKGIAHTVASARWGFIAAAAGVEVLFVVNLALFYMTTFRATGVRADPRRFLLLTSASHFVNLTSKTGGLGGIALYLQESRRTGQSPVRASAAYMIAYALGYAAFFIVLILALVLLYARGSLKPIEVAASVVILCIIAGVGTVIASSLRSQESLERLYLLAARPVNFVARLLRRQPFVDSEAAHTTTTELYEAVTHVRQHPRRYVLPAFHALGVEMLSAGILYLMALSQRANIGFEAALAAYAISLLFSMIAITPSGLGFVEASLSVLLVSFGMSTHPAIAVALGYRLFEFWLPVLLGALSLLILRYVQPETMAS
jgi:glycosyltransferase 2 family protein